MKTEMMILGLCLGIVGCGQMPQVPSLPTQAAQPQYTYTNAPCPAMPGSHADALISIPSLPSLNKQGLWGCIPETTPVVFQNRVLLVTYGNVIRNDGATLNAVKVFDYNTKEMISVGEGANIFGSAIVTNNRLYYFTTASPNVQMMYTDDLITWSKPITVLTIQAPDAQVFNTSVTESPLGYVMTYEVNGSDNQGPYGYSWRVASSPDLIHWTTISGLYSRDYTACPTIRYVNGAYQILYLIPYESQHVTVATQTQDFVNYSAPSNIVLAPSAGEGINASDVDLVEYEGQTLVVYLNGNQVGWEQQMSATFAGTLEQFYSAIWAN